MMKQEFAKEDKVKIALDAMVKNFIENADLPATIAKTFLEQVGKPSDNWSLSNKLIAQFVGQTTDARTYNQWTQVGRNVKKGQKAFYILAPNTFKVHQTNKETGQTEDLLILKGFRGLAEFGIDQTEGDEVKYVVEPKEVPALYDVAVKLGINVKYGRGDGSYWGAYNKNKRDITLCTADQVTFFHELVHAVQHKLDGKFKGGQDAEQETIAQLGACVIAAIYGMDARQYTKNYINGYIKDSDKLGAHCLKVCSKVEKILNYIFELVE